MPKREVRYNIKLAGIWKMNGRCNPFANIFQRCWESEEAAPRRELLTGNTCQVQHPCVRRAAQTKETLLAVSARPWELLPGSILKGPREGLSGLSPVGKRDPRLEERMRSSRGCGLDVLGWQSAEHLSDTPEPFSSRVATRSEVSQALKPIWYLSYTYPHWWCPAFLSNCQPPRSPHW